MSSKMSKTPATPPPDAVSDAVQPGSRGVMSVEDAKRLKPEDIGLSFGKPMTEEEFAAYRAARRGGRPIKVLK